MLEVVVLAAAAGPASAVGVSAERTGWGMTPVGAFLLFLGEMGLQVGAIYALTAAGFAKP